METAGWYQAFGEREARGESPTYERLALAVAGDSDLLARLDELPPAKRQPNLLFGAVRLLGGPVDDPAAFRAWTLAHWPAVAEVMRERSTQTNEPGRCAALLPVLARLPQPLALLEVGASAGLCLYPDAYRYRYRYGDDPRLIGAPNSLGERLVGAPNSLGERLVGAPNSPVELDCAVTGPVPVPERVPTVVWRAGLDLNPLDISRDDDLRWLDALVWPEHQHRRQRLHAAARVARTDPPLLVAGDLLTDLPALAAQAPADATLVVFHSAVLAYVPPPQRATFTDLVRELPGHWISNESLSVLPHLSRSVPAPETGAATFLLALDGRPLALTAPHGQQIHWLDPAEV